jgi:hypothetical protein
MYAARADTNGARHRRRPRFTVHTATGKQTYKNNSKNDSHINT